MTNPAELPLTTSKDCYTEARKNFFFKSDPKEKFEQEI